MTQAPARRGVGRRRGPEAGGAPWAPGSPKRPRPFSPKGSPGWLGASHRHMAGVLCRFLRGRSERPTPSHVLSLGTQDRSCPAGPHLSPGQSLSVNQSCTWASFQTCDRICRDTPDGPCACPQPHPRGGGLRGPGGRAGAHAQGTRQGGRGGLRPPSRGGVRDRDARQPLPHSLSGDGPT